MIASSSACSRGKARLSLSERRGWVENITNFPLPNLKIFSIRQDDSTISDAADLIDALAEHFSFVPITRAYYEPPAAGSGPVMALLVSFVHENQEVIKWTAGALASGMIGVLCSESYRKVRQGLAKVTQLRLATSPERKRASLVIEIERIRLVFDEPVNEEEITVRLQSSSKVVESIPETQLRPQNVPPDDMWYYWRGDDGKWTGGIALTPEQLKEWGFDSSGPDSE